MPSDSSIDSGYLFGGKAGDEAKCRDVIDRAVVVDDANFAGTLEGGPCLRGVDAGESGDGTRSEVSSDETDSDEVLP